MSSNQITGRIAMDLRVAIAGFETFVKHPGATLRPKGMTTVGIEKLEKAEIFHLWVIVR